MSVLQSARTLVACAALAAIPLASQASIFVANHKDHDTYGPLTFHPPSVTIAMQLFKPGYATFRVSQRVIGEGQYKGPMRGRMQCAVGLLGKPRIELDDHTVTVYVPPQKVAVSVGCYATIVGGGGVTGTEPITIEVGL